MKTKLLFLITFLAMAGGSLYGQGTQNVKGAYGCGSPASSNVVGDVGSRYIDQCANPPVEWIITAINPNGLGNGVPTATWTQGGSSSGGGNAFQNAVYVGPKCLVGNANNCFFANFDTQYAFTVTCSNASQTIATAASDPPFVAGDVGKAIAGVNSLNQTANCPPQGTITGFTDAHHVTVSIAATANTSTGSLGWGHDDGAQIAAAFTASLGSGCLFLPQGNAFFSVPPFLDQRSQPVGTADCVTGTGQTLLTPLPSFNYSSCITNGACVFIWPNGTNQNPNYAMLKDFEVFGLGYKMTGTGTTNFVFNLQRVTMFNVWLWHWGNDIGTGMFFTGPVSAFSPISDSSGVVACSIGGTGGNATVQLFTPFCGENGQSMSVGNGAVLESFGGQYGPGGAAGQAENVQGHWLSVGEVHFQPNSTADTIRIGAGGNLILDDAQVFGGVSNTLGSLDCNSATGSVQLRGRTVISGAPAGGGTAGIALRSVAGCKINNQSGGLASISTGTLSLSGVNIGQPSETQTGACVANAATVTFSNLYSQAPLVNVSDTTSGSTGAQATATSATTATIHCNGATDTFVATVIPNPI